MGVEWGSPRLLTVSFVVYDDNSLSILVDRPCPTTPTVHIERLALPPSEGARLAVEVSGLLARCEFVKRCQSLDDATAFARSVLDTLEGL
jgi:hypothetical protein